MIWRIEFDAVLKWMLMRGDASVATFNSLNDAKRALMTAKKTGTYPN